MTPQPSEQPRTAAGRRLLDDPFGEWNGREPLRQTILAIEAEQYDLASNDGYHAGIADCKAHDPAHQAAAPDPVASRQRWDYDGPHPFESKDLGNPTYDFCICERRRTDAMHLPDPVASQPEAVMLLRAVRDADVIFAKGDWPLSQRIATFLDEVEGAVATPAPLDRYGGLIAAMDNATAQGLTVHMATRATCAEHLEHGDDKATEPLTAAAFGLDVERLARAIWNATPLRHVGGIGEPDEWAAAIAAEYARLEGQPAGEEPA